ncbi:hypothetical protein Tdes44962_MAKER10046 [Teratosphaeria destructans]|uniref:Uncharacterized protein n=1 Tax=Teratosphaeria destructans TaxID=418781 RepID=A0A9W7SPM6_9PEZI|nr:hypothetical protein Tdes44962_MAKER10046 [Teratosphaeria destructans]
MRSYDYPQATYPTLTSRKRISPGRAEPIGLATSQQDTPPRPDPSTCPSRSTRPARRRSSAASPTTAATTTTSRRRASSAALHRRPFWAKNETALQAIRDPRRESATPFRQSRSIDYGTDNFSYDPVHIRHFELPADIAPHLDPELLARAHEWIMAGAALMTALVRIRESCTHAVHSAFPRTSAHAVKHLSVSTTESSKDCMPRRPSAADSVMVGSDDDDDDDDTPPDSFPDTPVSSPSTPNLSWWTILPEKDALMKGISQAGMDETRPIELAGMESPPFTPWDAKASSGHGPPTPSTATASADDEATPRISGSRQAYLSPAKYASTGPVTADDEGGPRSPSPVSRRASSCSSPPFCERSWEYYLGRYNEQLRDSKQCVMRLKGYGRNIDILRTELRGETTRPEAVIALINFGKWWDDMQAQAREHEREWASLQVPELEAVERAWYAMQPGGEGLASAAVSSSRGNGAD